MSTNNSQDKKINNFVLFFCLNTECDDANKEMMKVRLLTTEKLLLDQDYNGATILCQDEPSVQL